MDDYFMMRRHVPEFGMWESGECLTFTECFDSARHGGLRRYTWDEENDEEDDEEGDLYVTGDLYQNDVVIPAMIVVPRSNPKFRRSSADMKKAKKQSNVQPITPSPVRFPKPVDEDLYKISPEVLRNNAKKKRGFGIFASCCLVTTCSP